jgi:DNA repair protein RadC
MKTEPDTQTPHYHGHRDRLRARFNETAGEGMPDYELLEILLFSAIPRRDVKPLAKDLLARFGDLSGVLSAPVGQLTEAGLGDNATTLLKVLYTAAGRLTRQRLSDKPVMGCWEDVLTYCHTTMAFEGKEQFRLLFLDSKNKLIRDEVQQRGTVNHTPVYPREVVKRALDLNATAVILVHNHPSGDPKPSADDIQMTQQVQNALRGVGIVLHDHVIIGASGHYSFRGHALLS